VYVLSIEINSLLFILHTSYIWFGYEVSFLEYKNDLEFTLTVIFICVSITIFYMKRLDSCIYVYS
jgi:hypothetical protein